MRILALIFLLGMAQNALAEGYKFDDCITPIINTASWSGVYARVVDVEPSSVVVRFPHHYSVPRYTAKADWLKANTVKVDKSLCDKDLN